jgi:hypothetical protein
MSDHEIGAAVIRYGSEMVDDPGVQEFVGAVVGSPAVEAGAWLADSIRYKRWKSQLKILTKAQRDLANAGIDPQTVDLSVLVPLLELGSLTEDEDLQNRWAALLANAAEGNGTVPPAYPSILSQLAPRDARVLDAIYEWVGGEYRTKAVPISEVAEGVEVIGEWAELAVENLQRLRLVKPSSLTFPGAVQESFDEGFLTALGYDFVYHCRPPGRQLPGT